MEQEEKYNAIKNLVDHGGNKNRIACRFDVSMRTVNRWIKGYREKGKAFFVHGNTGRAPACKVSDEVRKSIAEIYKKDYEGCNFAFFTCLLAKYEDIHVSEQTVRNILEAEGIYPVKMWKCRKKRIRQEAKRREQELEKAKEKKADPASDSDSKEPEQTPETVPITNTVQPEDAHSRKPRSKYFGEQIQMDASECIWFGDDVTTLHVAIDDSLGRIVGAWIEKEETLSGYYHVLKQILLNYGIPVSFLTDRRTVFTYRRSEETNLEKDTFTQFSYACSKLGITIDTTSIPETKGRVERLNETLQGRLPFVLKKEGITDINVANQYISTHLDELFNDAFALPYDHTRDAFETQFGNEPITEEMVNLYCSVLCTRSISGQCVRYDNAYWKLVNKDGIQQNFVDHTRVTVIKTLDDQLFASVNDTHIFKLEEVPLHEKQSKILDVGVEEKKPRTIYIPPMNHPWRTSSFDRHVKSQKHRAKLEQENEDPFYEELQNRVINGELIAGHTLA